MMRDNVAAQLVVDNSRNATIPGAKERLLRKHSDVMDPTLRFSDEELVVAQTLYYQEGFRRGNFDEITKKYLFLPQEQNKSLTGNIETEDLFKRFEHDPRFKNVFRFKNQILEVSKQLRIGLRPLVLAIAAGTELSRHTRACGEKFGYTYPEI